MQSNDNKREPLKQYLEEPKVQHDTNFDADNLPEGVTRSLSSDEVDIGWWIRVINMSKVSGVSVLWMLRNFGVRCRGDDDRIGGG